MQNISLSCSALIFSMLCLPVFSQEDCSEEELSRPLRISFKTTQGKGVGYKRGYSSIEGFFSPIHKVPVSILPFIDARVHIFNNGDPAGNFGLGTRFLQERTWGINGYYDFRKSSHFFYNQVGMGLESLGEYFDVRMNGYMPVGRKKSSPFAYKFFHFTGHSMILGEKKEFAFKSADAEIATRMVKLRKRPAYLAAGPYYLAGQGKRAIGGKFRFAFTFFSYFSGEAIASYDNIFKGIWQGRVALNLPLGPKGPCPVPEEELRRKSRSHQRIDRNEIIPTENRYYQTVAVNPETKDPYVFWFVDNTQYGDGTFEHPYHRLELAELSSSPYDVIYVYPGDGTTTGLETGFVMKKGQDLLGTSLRYQFPVFQHDALWTVRSRALSKTAPTITLDTPRGYDSGIVVLADNCRVSGLNLSSISSFSGAKTAAISSGPPPLDSSPGVKDIVIASNVITGEYSQGGIYLHNPSGSILVYDTTLSGIKAPVTIGIITDASQVDFSARISQNTISGGSGPGIYFQNADGMTAGQQEIVITGNSITDAADDSIRILNSGSASPSSIPNQYIAILGNEISNSAKNGIFVLNFDTVDIGVQKITIDHNNVSNCTDGRSIFVQNNGIGLEARLQEITITNNTVGSTGGTGITGLEGIFVLNYTDVALGVQTVTIEGNVISDTHGAGIGFANNQHITSLEQTILIKKNEVTGSLTQGIFLQNDGPSGSNSLCIEVKNNKLIQSTVAGITLETYSESNTKVSFLTNTFTKTSSSTGLHINPNNNSTICARIVGNSIDKDIVFTEADAGIAFVEPIVGNTYQAITGTYTEVAPGSCDCGP